MADKRRWGDPRPPEPKSRANRRMLERQRQRRRRVLLTVALVSVVAVGAAGAIALAPYLGRPSSGPGQVAPTDQPMHIHVHLALFRDAQQATLPGDIGQYGGRWADHGLDPYLSPNEGQVGTMSPIHTHDSSGTVHVESRVTRGYTLGEFFSVWGQPIGPERTVDLVPDANHTLTMFVDGQPSDAWGGLVLTDGANIEIRYTTV